MADGAAETLDTSPRLGCCPHGSCGCLESSEVPDNNYLPFLQAALSWFWESLYCFSLFLSAFSAFLILLIQLLIELRGGFVNDFFF